MQARQRLQTPQPLSSPAAVAPAVLQSVLFGGDGIFHYFHFCLLFFTGKQEKKIGEFSFCFPETGEFPRREESKGTFLGVAGEGNGLASGGRTWGSSRVER